MPDKVKLKEDIARILGLSYGEEADVLKSDGEIVVIVWQGTDCACVPVTWVQPVAEM